MFYYADSVCTVLALVAIISAVLVVGQAVVNPVNAVLWLIVSFVAVAAYLITAGMTFLGLSYVIVYVGAIAVLFLFVVMMLNLAGQENIAAETPHLAGNKMWPVASLILMAGAFYVLPLSDQLSLVVDIPGTFLYMLNGVFFTSESTPVALTAYEGAQAVWVTPVPMELVSPMNQVQVLGLTLYTHGALWLMLISVLLMLAIIVPLALAFTA